MLTHTWVVIVVINKRIFTYTHTHIISAFKPKIYILLTNKFKIGLK